MTTRIGYDMNPAWYYAIGRPDWARVVGVAPLAAIHWSYYFWAADVRWLMPVLHYRSDNWENWLSISWTIANRLYTFRDKPSIPGGGDEIFPVTYWGALRSFCQEVDPYYATPGSCVDWRLHAALQAMPITAFPTRVFDAAIGFTTGQYEPQPRTASTTSFGTCGGRPASFSIDGICYYPDPEWPHPVTLQMRDVPRPVPRGGPIGPGLPPTRRDPPRLPRGPWGSQSMFPLRGGRS